MTESRPWVPVEGITGVLAAELSLPPSTTGGGVRPAVMPNPLRVVTYNVQLGLDVEALAVSLLEHPGATARPAYLLQEEEAHQGPRRLAARLGFGYVYVPARGARPRARGLAILCGGFR